jgi:hypothetical protein
VGAKKWLWTYKGHQGLSYSFVFVFQLLSTFDVTIQNTTILQFRNLFSVIAVFISFSPWRAAAAAAALAVDFCCCCCTRPHPTPPPSLGEGSTKKRKSTAAALVLGYVCVGVGDVVMAFGASCSRIVKV